MTTEKDISTFRNNVFKRFRSLKVGSEFSITKSVEEKNRALFIETVKKMTGDNFGKKYGFILELDGKNETVIKKNWEQKQPPPVFVTKTKKSKADFFKFRNELYVHFDGAPMDDVLIIDDNFGSDDEADFRWTVREIIATGFDIRSGYVLEFSNDYSAVVKREWSPPGSKIEIETQQAATWNFTGLDSFFENIELPTEPIKLKDGSIITGVKQFIETHMTMAKANNGNHRFKPYYDRLQELKQVLTPESKPNEPQPKTENETTDTANEYDWIPDPTVHATLKSIDEFDPRIGF